MEVDPHTGLEYKLSQIIEAHTNDVKALSSTETGALVSCSRDDYVRMFVEKEHGFTKYFEVNNRMIVNSIDVYHTPNGSILIFCGRKDGSIAAFDPEMQDPQFVLTEHSLNVCTLKVSQENAQLISGGWDSRAIVFDLNNLIFGKNSKLFALEGHKNSIWAVDFVPGHQNHFLTASADKTINLWRENRVITTFTGHTDVVRCLLVLNSECFLSAANDSTLRFWNIRTGKCERTIEATTGEFIYSMTRVQLPDTRQLIVTSGEYGFVEFFGYEGEKDLTYAQVLRTPAVSLWSIRALPNGDLAVAANDGNIYIFTANHERFASASILETFDASVAAKIKKDAELKAEQNKDTVTIKVSLDDGAPTTEFKYKKGTDPADAAANFIREYNLPYSYLDDITEYIKANVPEARNYSAYKSTNGSSAGGDPFTSAGRYIPGSQQQPMETGFQDPLTGGGRYVPGGHESTTNTLLPNSLAPADKRRPRSDLVPVRKIYTFGYEGASAKAQEALKSANASVSNDLVLEDPLIESLFEIMNGEFTANEIHILALEKALQWPLECIVPVLDVFRLSLLNETINEYFCSVHGEKRGKQTLERIFAILVSEPLPPVRIFICRSLANAAKHQFGQEMLLTHVSQLSDLVTQQILLPGSKAPLQLAASCCLANVAMLLLRQTEKGVCAELGPREDVLRSIIKFAEKVLSFGDICELALQRFLQTIVTLMWGDQMVIEMGKKRGIDDIVMRIKDAVSSEDSKNIARDIYAMQ
ncbi:hypothetical protein M3Y97_00491700 [Aphelenchoides bicaudatus]|nr:hypothetical protein M3Y97_00491700 [Aphelenchoides bicaudatus]